MKKFLLFLVVGVALLGGGYAMAKRSNGDAKKPGEEDPNAPKTVRVERGRVSVVVTSTGKVVAHQVVEVKSKAGGEVTRVVPEVGDPVKLGDLIVELDPSDERRSVERTEAQVRMEEARLESARSSLELARSDYERGKETAASDVASATAALEEARARFERQKSLRAQGTISAQEFDSAESAYLQAKAALESAVARQADREHQKFLVAQREEDIAFQEAQLKTANIVLDEARERLSETRIVAPITGVLTDKKVEVGQVISSAISNVGGGTALVTVSDLSRLYIDASVDEVDIGQVKKDQIAIVTADSYPAERFQGRVLRVAPQGQEVNNVVVFNVRLEVEGDGLLLLKPGMTVNVSIQAGERDDALLIPLEAIYYEEENAQSYVLLNDHEKEAKATKIYFVSGLSDGLKVEVIEGLTEGQELKIKRAMENRRWKR